MSLLSMQLADLLAELESLVEHLDEQEASKQQALSRAEAAETEAEALRSQLTQNAAVSSA